MKHIIKQVFPKTVPVLAGYLSLGIAFGLLLQSIGYGPGWAFIMSLLVYAGSAQFLAVELLAAIPSVIYGLLGMMLLNPLLYKMEKRIFANSTTHQFTGGANLLAAIIVLAIMILPTVISISVSSLRAVPAHLKSASLALGATHIQTIFKVLIPAAKSGIMTGIVLGVGRAIGEAMAINMVAGGSVNIPLPFNSVRFLTTQIVSEMAYADGLHRQVLFTVGLVLFVFIMIINLILAKMKKKGEAKND